MNTTRGLFDFKFVAWALEAHAAIDAAPIAASAPTLPVYRTFRKPEQRKIQVWVEKSAPQEPEDAD